MHLVDLFPAGTFFAAVAFFKAFAAFFMLFTMLYEGQKRTIILPFKLALAYLKIGIHSFTKMGIYQRGCNTRKRVRKPTQKKNSFCK